MKRTYSHIPAILLVLIMAASACGPSQRITNSWSAPDATSNAPYEKIFLMALSPESEFIFPVEDRLAAVIKSRGQEFELSSVLFPPQLGASDILSKEQMTRSIQDTGCDAVFIVSLLNKKTVTTYHQDEYWSPYGYGYYDSFHGYYYYYYPQVYSSGYYTQDDTYHIETSFFDLEQDRLLWLMQSEAYNPSSVDSWFDTYMHQLLDELERENMLQDL
jgi:hypothetical protein